MIEEINVKKTYVFGFSNINVQIYKNTYTHIHEITFI